MPDSKPIGRALRPVQDVVITPEDIDDAKEAWKSDAPEGMRRLLDAAQPLEKERRARHRTSR